MKDKLLFYIDNFFVHFGIAKAIREKYDCELYAIIDVDTKAKKFFENQSWYSPVSDNNFVKLSNIETQNTLFIKNLEKSK